MLCRIFSGHPQEVEKDVNKWLTEIRDMHSIMYVTQSSTLIPSYGGAKDGMAVTILYNESK